jgi:4-hydroxy-tetrahydrodipicolinate synthase
MKKHFIAQIEAGVHGLVVVGSLGENSTLSLNEKQEVLKTAVAASNGRVPVIATLAGGNTADAQRFAQLTSDNGGNGIMILPPMRYKSDRRETLAYFRSIAKASELPIMIYNNPIDYGVDVTPEMFAELIDEEKIVAIKESSRDVRRITDLINLVNSRYQIFCGVDDIALECLVLGANGWLAGLACAFPRETVMIYNLQKSGKLKEALDLYRWFMPLLHLDVSTKLVQNIKLAEAMVEIGNEYVRPPRLPLAGEERKNVIKIIQEALDSKLELSRLII